MNRHYCLLCLGSNFQRQTCMKEARQALFRHFPNILFGEEMETEAIGQEFFSPFSNQLACLDTEMEMEDVRLILKEIERANGRQEDDKAQGIVRLDIDILIFDQIIVKEKDLQRDYIRRGMEKLKHLSCLIKPQELF